MKELKNIKNILFDCDGVLYQDLKAVFGQVSKKMTQYISNKLNVDLNPEISAKFGIRSIPTILMFKDGSPVDQIVGSQPKSNIESRIKEIL